MATQEKKHDNDKWVCVACERREEKRFSPWEYVAHVYVATWRNPDTCETQVTRDNFATRLGQIL